MGITIEQRKYAKGLAVREKAVAAASQLFAARGYGGCSVADLAAAAKISRNQLFHHFASKENLALACVQRAGQSLENEVTTPAAIHPNPINQLVFTIDKLGELQRDGWPYTRLLATFAASEAELPSAVRKALQDVLESIFKVLRGMFKEAKKTGQLPGGSKARLVAAQLLSTILGSAALAGFGETFYADEVLAHLRGLAGVNAGMAAI